MPEVIKYPTEWVYDEELDQEIRWVDSCTYEVEGSYSQDEDEPLSEGWVVACIISAALVLLGTGAVLGYLFSPPPACILN